MVIWDGLKKLTDELGDRREAELLMCFCLECSITDLVLEKNRELTESQEQKLFEVLKRRLCGEPVQYIVGSTEFMSLEFKVTSDVLIPRSDTESLVEYLIDILGERELKILDIGTGSGCIAISLLKYCPNVTAVALDISEGALAVAKENAILNGVEDRIELLRADILEYIPDGTFDCLVSNPPYIRPEVIEGLDRQVKDFEPYRALFGGEDGLMFYRRICEIAPRLLGAGGVLAFEIGYDQGESVAALLDKDFYEVRVLKDLCQNDRVVTGKYKKGMLKKSRTQKGTENK